MADVRIIQSAAGWLAAHDRTGRTEADNAKLLAHVVRETGLHENVVFDVLVDRWADVRAAASSGKHQAAAGGVGAQLKASGHESPPAPGITIHPIQDKSWIDEKILLRSEATDHKGRMYGTQRNRALAPMEVFNPRFWDVRAGDLDRLITGRKHEAFPSQQLSISRATDEVVLAVNHADPISARWVDGGLSMTGGHHRTWELIDRVNTGKLDPNTPVRILVHE